MTISEQFELNCSTINHLYKMECNLLTNQDIDSDDFNTFCGQALDLLESADEPWLDEEVAAHLKHIEDSREDFLHKINTNSKLVKYDAVNHTYHILSQKALFTILAKNSEFIDTVLNECHTFYANLHSRNNTEAISLENEIDCMLFPN